MKTRKIAIPIITIGPHSARRILCFCLLTALSLNAVKAQEYTKEVCDTKTEFSIVRSIDDTKRLVCNNVFGTTSFMLFTDASATTSDLYLDNDFNVSDFIVRDNSVFFLWIQTRLVNKRTEGSIRFFQPFWIPLHNRILLHSR